jgi:hypothetical protein
MNKKIWHWYVEDDGVWHKLLYLPDQSCLSDVFEYMEDYISPKKYGHRHKKGMTITMDYGCMGNLIEKGELVSKKLIWLDDYRDPSSDDGKKFVFKYANFFIDYPDNIVWVKNYNEFVEEITKNGLPHQISFDHDLADEHYAPESRYNDYEAWAGGQDFKEKTGMDCAHWLIDYCLDNKETLPMCTVHSQNPSGAININSLLTSFIRSQII